MEELVVCEIYSNFKAIKLCHCLFEEYLFYFTLSLREGVGRSRGRRQGCPAPAQAKGFKLVRYKLKIRGEVVCKYYLSELYLSGNYLINERTVP